MFTNHQRALMRIKSTPPFFAPKSLSQFADVMVLPTQTLALPPIAEALRHGKTDPASSSNMVRVHTPWRAIMI